MSTLAYPLLTNGPVTGTRYAFNPGTPTAVKVEDTTVMQAIVMNGENAFQRV